MTDWPAGYAFYPGLNAVSGPLALRPIRWDDRASIRRWRNDQIDVLRQEHPLSEEDQDRYFLDVVRSQMAVDQPPQLLFGLENDGTLIGYGGLVHIQWADRRAEVSFLTDPARLDPETFAADWNDYLRLLTSVATRALSFHKVTTETYEIRPDVISILESYGFVREGTHPEHHRVGERWVTSYSHGLLLESQPQ